MLSLQDGELPWDSPRQRTSLDPDDWQILRKQGHQMLDDMLNHLATLSEKPVWQPAPLPARTLFDAPLPVEPTAMADVHAIFRDNILPYGSGNIHPGFMGWVQGGGTVAGMLAEMLAGGLNANLGGRDHMPIEVERQIIRWTRQIFSFPDTAGGLFLTGASQANFVAVLLALGRKLGADVRAKGLSNGARLVAYASNEVHGCVPRACEMSGIGSDQLRRIPANSAGQIDIAALERAIIRDNNEGHTPFLIIGSAGTVNTGAIDDLTALRSIANAHDLHFHVDGALGALGILCDDLAHLFTGIQSCDSLAFDFHKWGQVPYDAGFLLVRDSTWQRQTFASDAAYLSRAASGLAGGDWWPCDYGPDLSRGFRALKTWFTLKTYGLKALGDSMAANCALARGLAGRIEREPALRLLAPVALNIVCFAYVGPGGDAPPQVNARIIEHLHAEGRVAPSLTHFNGQPAIRAAIVNHRTQQADIDALIDGVLKLGSRQDLLQC
ncbi:pyridoxal phosphate-dependent decarboxylase family protein [Rhizobium leucaenae]|uniref:Glutamate/tyrosine decarboxylase-like PLP-dependent enzyme n=1 Tax=Rhizobium leucaenae TaxID=29450 RepID=A0A7W7EJ13_9HYPH|nr:pyridoxal-dependent decarboxylase [Rhizobium leucaenae]MBB4567315.1 glutamate/tyrosine decarboxylase-like PLP-dependent enzyme [Rhizobium leucaenae]MBB6303063.1 glutamate/tyrosine decarboxylase-like PLP-dependent enzyme [Rhizobium leucaenae]